MFRSPNNARLSLVTVLVYGFLYLPIVVLIVFSFNSSRINASWTGFTVQWYRALMADSGIQQALRNSLSVSLGATALATITGTFVAHALQRSRLLARPLFNSIIYLPLIIPDIVIGVALVTLYVSVHLELGITTLVFSHLVFDSSYVAIIVLSRLRVYDPKIE